MCLLFFLTYLVFVKLCDNPRMYILYRKLLLWKLLLRNYYSDTFELYCMLGLVAHEICRFLSATKLDDTLWMYIFNRIYCSRNYYSRTIDIYTMNKPIITLWWLLPWSAFGPNTDKKLVSIHSSALLPLTKLLYLSTGLLKKFYSLCTLLKQTITYGVQISDEYQIQPSHSYD
jgi:hypothetical protein